MAQAAATPTYKVLLLGDGGVGKSTFMKRHLTGEYDKTYVATVGWQVLPLTFYTTHGPITFDVWDVAGQDRLATLRETDYVNSHGAILMFDVTSPVTYSSVTRWYKDVTRVCGDIPIVLCGNKVDRDDRKVKAPTSISTKLQYYDISAKSNYQFEKPFIYLAKKLSTQPDLQLATYCCAGVPPEVKVDTAMVAEIEKELQMLPPLALPDDEDL